MYKKQKHADERNRERKTEPLKPHLEKFCQVVAEGYSHVEAAEIAGRSRGSASYLFARPGVIDRIRELRLLVQSATEEEVAIRAGRAESIVNITRNDIINGLHHEALTAKSSCARVTAWRGLAEIYMLYPKTLKDVEDFYGWTDEEIEEYAKTGKVPDRLRDLLAGGETPRLSGTPSRRVQKKARRN